MPSAEAVWEDDENSRKVSFVVEYTVESEGIQLVEVTPSQIEFSDSRTIGVWTDKGRAMLVSQADAAGEIDRITKSIEAEVLATS